MITKEQYQEFEQEFDAITKLYKEEFSVKVERDYGTYEQQWASRIKKAAKEINKVIWEADRMIKRTTLKGRPSTLSSRQKVLILLIKDIFQLSNRKMANLTIFFSILTGMDTSYKMIERSYSDPLVGMIIHNMFVVMTRRKGISNPDLTGDGTGYSLTITKHYRSLREKLGDKIKSHDTINDASGEKVKDKKIIVYGFALMDLDTKLYVGYGASIKSEREAFEKALIMMQISGVTPNSVRLDKYYGIKSTLTEFDQNTTVYVIPKKNLIFDATGSWGELMDQLVLDPIQFLHEYYKRENSETGFSADKKCDGWKIWQKRGDRIETATLCKGVWHNLLWLDGSK